MSEKEKRREGKREYYRTIKEDRIIKEDRTIKVFKELIENDCYRIKEQMNALFRHVEKMMRYIEEKERER